jgi:hypothetical protein
MTLGHPRPTVIAESQWGEPRSEAFDALYKRHFFFLATESTVCKCDPLGARLFQRVYMGHTNVRIKVCQNICLRIGTLC